MFTDLSNDIANLYSDSGPLAKNIQNYVFRSPQVELAQKIHNTIKSNKILLAEAGTGTGKTLAYLIPALLSSNPVIISTGTKNLQNQLFFRDLPLVIKALNITVKTALLKGRNNYLCKYRLEIAMTDLLLATSDMVLQLKQIINWSESCTDGDISTLSDIPEDAAIWKNVTSNKDNCLAQDCPLINNCFVYKARQRAADAKVVVVNHHLLLSDWNLKDAGKDVQLLPNGTNLILDEAHQIAETASYHFGQNFSSSKLKDLLSDISIEFKLNIKDEKKHSLIIISITRLLQQMQQYFLNKPEQGLFANLYQENILKSDCNGINDINDINDINNLYDLLEKLKNILQTNAVRSKSIEACLDRCEDLLSELDIFCNDSITLENNSSSISSSIKWYEYYKNNFIFKQSPLEVNKLFRDKLDKVTRSCILTSATMSVAGSFDLIKRDLGLESAETISISSPFNYKEKSMLYIPRSMPDPKADNFVNSYIEQVIPVLNYSKGGAFLLFTSFNIMHQVYDKIVNLDANICPVSLSNEIKFNFLMQGQASKSSLIDRFRANKHSILFATASFWEGIDVKGEDLHCVVIDKLPFASPTDPLLNAKINHLRKQGKNPFIDLQCQQAALQLTQGAGRLIRSESDYGVLMICDPRIISRYYGQFFLNSLPPMQRTRDINKIKDFYSNY